MATPTQNIPWCFIFMNNSGTVDGFEEYGLVGQKEERKKRLAVGVSSTFGLVAL